MANFNANIHAAVTVTFDGGTTDPLIATDPTSGLQVAFNVASVARKVGEPVGVYTVILDEPIGAFEMDPHCTVWCTGVAKGASVHPTIDPDGLVQQMEIQGHDLAGAPADIMFVLKIFKQWVSP